jgi:hypothetical protein
MTPTSGAKKQYSRQLNKNEKVMERNTTVWRAGSLTPRLIPSI